MSSAVMVRPAWPCQVETSALTSSSVNMVVPSIGRLGVDERGHGRTDGRERAVEMHVDRRRCDPENLTCLLRRQVRQDAKGDHRSLAIGKLAQGTAEHCIERIGRG